MNNCGNLTSSSLCCTLIYDLILFFQILISIDPCFPFFYLQDSNCNCQLQLTDSIIQILLVASSWELLDSGNIFGPLIRQCSTRDVAWNLCTFTFSGNIIWAHELLSNPIFMCPHHSMWLKLDVPSNHQKFLTVHWRSAICTESHTYGNLESSFLQYIGSVT